MDINPHEEARRLYDRYIRDTGYSAPENYEELLLFVELSGASVFVTTNPPECFEGIQIGESIFISGAEGLSDYVRMHILAHEWCHWLRRGQVLKPGYRLYRSSVLMNYRDWEEEIANYFEGLF